MTWFEQTHALSGHTICIHPTTTFSPLSRIFFLPWDPARKTGKLVIIHFDVILRCNVLSTGTTKSNDASLESGKKVPQVTIWHVIAQPRVLMLCLAASIRHCGEYIHIIICINIGRYTKFVSKWVTAAIATKFKAMTNKLARKILVWDTISASIV